MCPERFGPLELPRNEAEDLLRWYVDMGVDEAIGEDSVDRYAQSQAAAQRVAAAPPPPQVRQAPGLAEPRTPSPAAAPAVNTASASQDELAESARERAERCSTLEELRAALEAFDECGLKRTAKNLVFSDGNPDGRVMFIGEAPGRDEDLQGKSFVGRSGQLLDRMLAAIGLDRDSVYIANVIYWRPPGNRDPSPVEMAQCRPFIKRQIELANPDIIVPIGAVPARELIGTTSGILRLRGQWKSYQVNGRDVPVLPSLHPAYLLRQPAQKKLAWRDFLAIRRKLDEPDNKSD